MSGRQRWGLRDRRDGRFTGFRGFLSRGGAERAIELLAASEWESAPWLDAWPEDAT